MNEKEFEIDDTTFTVSISHFQGPVPGKYHALPEDCYPDEDAEVEFDNNVEYAKNGDLETKTMEFNDFVKLYATSNDLGFDKATLRIEDETIAAILKEAEEYEP